MSLTECQEHLCGIEAHPFLGNAALRLTLEHAEKLPPSTIIHDKEEMVGALEAVVQCDYKWVVDSGKNLPLRQAALQLHRIEICQILLSQKLHKSM